jgi:hypothetical protein
MTTPTPVAFKERLLSEVLDHQRSVTQAEVTPSSNQRRSGVASKRGIGAGIVAAALVGAVAIGGFGSPAPAAAAETKAVAAVNSALNSKVLHVTSDFGEKTEVFTDRSGPETVTLTRYLDPDGSVRQQVAVRDTANGTSSRMLDMSRRQYRDTVIDGRPANASASNEDDSANVRSLISDGEMKQSGKETVNGREAIRLIGSDGRLTMLVDPGSFLPVRAIDATGSKIVTVHYEWLDRNAGNVPDLFPDIPAGFSELTLSDRSAGAPSDGIPQLAETPPVVPLDGSVFYVPRSANADKPESNEVR